MISFSSLKTKVIYLFWISLFAFPVSSQAYDGLVKQDGKPSYALQELFQALGYSSTNIFEMNTIAQRDFLRKAGQERWHMQEVSHDKEKIFPILEKLGVIDAISPTPHMLKSVDYIFIHGATVGRMQNRVTYFLENVWPHLTREAQERVKIIFLSGNRKLDTTLNEKETLFNPDSSEIQLRPDWQKPNRPIETENDAAQIIWDQLVPDKFLRDKVLFVSAPALKDGKRPTTKDTIKAWLKSFESFQKDPLSVSQKERLFWKNAPDLKAVQILAISNNPYIYYQDQVFRNALEEEGFDHIFLETVGSKAESDTLLAVYLDNIARWLYEVTNNLKKKALPHEATQPHFSSDKKGR
ncbi:MAG: hypothetical protein JSS34_02680 [Proteobacteria bacterium]|nr:hypothetical protein [Pseudomonadota bacterium]